MEESVYIIYEAPLNKELILFISQEKESEDIEALPGIRFDREISENPLSSLME